MEASLGKNANKVEDALLKWRDALKEDVLKEMEKRVWKVRLRVAAELSEEKAQTDRLGENGRLTTRSGTEKKDGLRVNRFYPSLDADNDNVHQASVALAAKVKLIERGTLFIKEPYN